MLKINPNPTFFSKLNVRIPGGQVEEVELEFKHRNREALSDFVTKAKERTERDVVADIIVGWRGMEEDFSAASLDALLKNYPGLASHVFTEYIHELMTARAGN